MCVCADESVCEHPVHPADRIPNCLDSIVCSFTENLRGRGAQERAAYVKGTGRNSEESPQIYKFISLVSHQGVNTVHSPVFS